MYIVKFLKRRDAASVVVAVVIGLILVSLLSGISNDLANRFAGTEQSDFGDSWQSVYAVPMISAIVGVLLLEVVLRIAVPLRSMFVRRK
jgi:hypothetical protein